MNFESFAESYGLIIDRIDYDRWIRVPTTDHPAKRNGAYKLLDGVGWVQNHATMQQPVLWRSDAPVRQDFVRIEKARQDTIARQQAAAKKAAGILRSAKKTTHPYLADKGFPDQKVYVWRDLMLLPMRVGDRLVGLQFIEANGSKRFLSGQVTKGASLVIDNKGPDILCEGFATAMSVRRAMQHLKRRYKIHVCFSAGNMLEVSKLVTLPLVIADNDPVGIKTAKQIGSRFWVGDVGFDFNDQEKKDGTHNVAVSLEKLL